ncbi:hypothetical protein BVG16_27895 [Paenibacillus selenitireducens]|uniref:Uncharacterized protein n=1 Tax=Paenibacillus selenitireducens TaxID=1324314 RepID=A0A1T2X176_9BACL|nr:hypothetical protein [Paenibacillus selenitireducens]OPA73630.1 hypothetical protein BVG16_27895 [Paenibacillus selenitireducens]
MTICIAVDYSNRRITEERSESYTKFEVPADVQCIDKAEQNKNALWKKVNRHWQLYMVISLPTGM